MIGFIIGLFVGAFIGVALMCLCNAASNADKNMEKFNLMFDYPFDRAQMILINEIKKEFLENYIFWKKINKIFVFLFIVFDILFVFSGYFVIHKLSVIYILFHYVSNRIQEALKPD